MYMSVCIKMCRCVSFPAFVFDLQKKNIPNTSALSEFIPKIRLVIRMALTESERSLSHPAFCTYIYIVHISATQAPQRSLLYISSAPTIVLWR